MILSDVHISLSLVAYRVLLGRNNVNSSNVLMKAIDSVSLYLVFCAIQSRQNNSAFCVEECISEIIEWAVLASPGTWDICKYIIIYIYIAVGFTFHP